MLSKCPSLFRLFLSFAAGIALNSGCTGPHSTPNTSQLRQHPRSKLTALDRYVQTPDSSYHWSLVATNRVEDCSVASIDLTSQSWLTPQEVNHTLWRHWLTIVTPTKLSHSTALVFISGGNNKDLSPPKPSDQLIAIARATHSVVAELKQVPNQPLIFGADGKERVEDDLISFTWDKFLRSGDERWPARLPMTKAAVRALDTITAFCASPNGGSTPVDRFIVAGGSKRGWTTWTTAVVDPRVVGICPIVIDLLNLEPSFVHHFQAYGFYAPAVDDYVKTGIMDWIGTSQYKRLLKIEEPYEYRDRLTLPKLILNATGDQFFLPDSSQFYFDKLPGVKYLRYVPNADHSLKGSDAYETLMAWHYALLNQTTLPKFDWRLDRDGSISVSSETKPAVVRLWYASNSQARDFRLETIGPAWKSISIDPIPGRPSGLLSYRGNVDSPTKGWTAYFVELTFEIGAPRPLKLTTQVYVTPDRLPFPPPKPLRSFSSRL